MELPYSNIEKFWYVLLFLETETLKKIPFRETKTEAFFFFFRKIDIFRELLFCSLSLFSW